MCGNADATAVVECVVWNGVVVSVEESAASLVDLSS